MSSKATYKKAVREMVVDFNVLLKEGIIRLLTQVTKNSGFTFESKKQFAKVLAALVDLEPGMEVTQKLTGLWPSPVDRRGDQVIADLKKTASRFMDALWKYCVRSMRDFYKTAKYPLSGRAVFYMSYQVFSNLPHDECLLAFLVDQIQMPDAMIMFLIDPVPVARDKLVTMIDAIRQSDASVPTDYTLPLDSDGDEEDEDEDDIDGLLRKLGVAEILQGLPSPKKEELVTECVDVETGIKQEEFKTKLLISKFETDISDGITTPCVRKLMKILVELLQQTNATDSVFANEGRNFVVNTMWKHFIIDESTEETESKQNGAQAAVN